MPDNQALQSDSGTSGKDTTRASVLYRALMAHVLHQDRLLWDVAQLLTAVQGAVLASSFTLRHYWLGPTILLFGAALTLVLLAWVVKTELDRDVNRAIMDKLADHLLPDTIKEELRQQGKSEPFVRIAATPPRWYILRGRHIARCVLIGFVVLDFVLAGLFCWANFLFP